MVTVIRVPAAPIPPTARQSMVRMRDGVRLASDVYLPQGDTSPGDTILIRLPYDKDGEYTYIPVIADYFMAHGYRVVAQDVRGKFRSEGETILFIHEPADGYDTIEWITQQEWSNGRVAMWGDSYYGYTQWAAVSAQHPALKAIAPRVTGTQLGEPVHRYDPAPTRRVEWGITFMYPLTFFHSQDVFYWELDQTQRPFSQQVEDFFAEVGQRSANYDLWQPRPVYLERFPFGHPFDARPVPTLQTIGWWDNCAPLSWRDVAEIEQRPAWSHNHFLRIESMDHESIYLLDPPERRTEEPTPEQIQEGLSRMLEPTLEFFEVFVRGNGRAEDVPKVTWNLAGTDQMRTAASWPPAGAREVHLWPAADGSLGTVEPDSTEAVTWVHDPEDPVPSGVPNAFAFMMYRPDEAPLGLRSDVLSFTSAPVEGDVVLAGPVSAVATVSSTGPCMDLFIRVLDLAPDGTALRIARGQVHVVDASAPIEVQVDLDQLGYQLQSGHRLRVHVSSSDDPEFLTLPGTGEDPWIAVETTTNTQTISLGRGGLRLTLGVLEGTLS